MATPQRAENQHETNQRAARDFAVADAALNRLYPKVVASLPAQRRAKLRRAQRAWVAWRDAEAAFTASEMEGGSAWPLLYDGARARLTRNRIAELEALLPKVSPGGGA